MPILPRAAGEGDHAQHGGGGSRASLFPPRVENVRRRCVRPELRMPPPPPSAVPLPRFTGEDCPRDLLAGLLRAARPRRLGDGAGRRLRRCRPQLPAAQGEAAARRRQADRRQDEGTRRRARRAAWRDRQARPLLREDGPVPRDAPRCRRTRGGAAAGAAAGPHGAVWPRARRGAGRARLRRQDRHAVFELRRAGRRGVHRPGAQGARA